MSRDGPLYTLCIWLDSPSPMPTRQGQDPPLTQGACRLHRPHELQSFENTCLAFPEALVLERVLGSATDVCHGHSSAGTALKAQPHIWCINSFA